MTDRFRAALARGPLILDAAMGTRLVARGLDLARRRPRALEPLAPRGRRRDPRARRRRRVRRRAHQHLRGQSAVAGAVRPRRRRSRRSTAAPSRWPARAAGPDRFVIGSIGPTAADDPDACREQADGLDRGGRRRPPPGNPDPEIGRGRIAADSGIGAARRSSSRSTPGLARRTRSSSLAGPWGLRPGGQLPAAGDAAPTGRATARATSTPLLVKPNARPARRPARRAPSRSPGPSPGSSTRASGSSAAAAGRPRRMWPPSARPVIIRREAQAAHHLPAEGRLDHAQ